MKKKKSNMKYAYVIVLIALAASLIYVFTPSNNIPLIVAGFVTKTGDTVTIVASENIGNIGKLASNREIFQLISYGTAFNCFQTSCLNVGGSTAPGVYDQCIADVGLEEVFPIESNLYLNYDGKSFNIPYEDIVIEPSVSTSIRQGNMWQCTDFRYTVAININPRSFPEDSYYSVGAISGSFRVGTEYIPDETCQDYGLDEVCIESELIECIERTVNDLICYESKNIEAGEEFLCGNDVCDFGETFEECPDDCISEGGIPGIGGGIIETTDENIYYYILAFIIVILLIVGFVKYVK